MALLLIAVLVVERGRCERVSLAGMDVGETWSGWGDALPLSCGKLLAA
jgi:hypothetical protein